MYWKDLHVLEDWKTEWESRRGKTYMYWKTGRQQEKTTTMHRATETTVSTVLQDNSVIDTQQTL